MVKCWCKLLEAENYIMKINYQDIFQSAENIHVRNTTGYLM